MTTLVPVGIAGMGRYVPSRRVPNAEFAETIDTSDEWITQRTGIRERRFAGPEELSSDMGVAAAREAIEDAGLTPADIDLILCCTITPDYVFPATACQIGDKLGAEQAGGFDVSGACSGWVLGAQTAAQFIATGAAKHVLVIGVEKLSSVLDFTDRGTCVLFGDGAGAAVFSPLEYAKHCEFLGGSSGMRGGTQDMLALPGNGNVSRGTPGAEVPGAVVPGAVAPEAAGSQHNYIHMDGRRVYRFAVKTFADLVRKGIEGHSMDDLGLVVPHQVNLRIIESAASQVGIPMDKILVNIDRFGNTSAASVPMALYEARETDRLVDGKLVCCVAFGAGLTWGHVTFRW